MWRRRPVLPWASPLTHRTLGSGDGSRPAPRVRWAPGRRSFSVGCCTSLALNKPLFQAARLGFYGILKEEKKFLIRQSAFSSLFLCFPPPFLFLPLDVVFTALSFSLLSLSLFTSSLLPRSPTSCLSPSAPPTQQTLAQCCVSVLVGP